MRGLLTFWLFACLAAQPAAAEIYRWVDADGVVHYSDAPKSRAAKPADLPGLQPLDKPPQLQTRQARSRSQDGPESTQLSLRSPQPQQTFRDANGRISASVAIDPELAPGQQLVYYLDGQLVGESPTRNTQIQLQGIPRGEHTISVALTSGDRELARTSPLTFYMKQPSALNPTNADSALPENQPTGAPTAPAGNRSGSAPAAPGFNPATPNN